MFSFPFSQVGASRMATSLLRPKLSLNTIITNLEKTVSTINQVVPLYTQVKPLISTSKSLITSTLKRKPKQTKTKKDFNKDVIDVSYVNKNYTKATQSNTDTEIFTDVSTPKKPFFS